MRADDKTNANSIVLFVETLEAFDECRWITYCDALQHLNSLIVVDFFHTVQMDNRIFKISQPSLIANVWKRGQALKSQDLNKTGCVRNAKKKAAELSVTRKLAVTIREFCLSTHSLSQHDKTRRGHVCGKDLRCVDGLKGR